jgi:hypothetical protein
LIAAIDEKTFPADAGVGNRCRFILRNKTRLRNSLSTTKKIGIVDKFSISELREIALAKPENVNQLVTQKLLAKGVSKKDVASYLVGTIAIVGLLTVAQFSFWGNYLPRVYPTHLRGTGESFAANIGGRILGTAAAWLTLTFSASTPPSPAKIAIVGAIVAGVYCFLGVLLSFWLKQPAAELLENE